jgi:hypothetical protein
MNSIKMRKIFMALLLAVFAAASMCGAAFAAVGDVVGLADFNTLDSVRPNTYDAEFGDEQEYDLAIIKIVEDVNGNYVPQFFGSAAEADPSNFTWTQNTASMYNAEIYVASGEARQMSRGNWYYFVPADCHGYTLGPDSWRAAYLSLGTDAYGDFSFVSTEYSSYPEYPVTAYDIKIEFRDHYQLPATFATGNFAQVQFGDDFVSDPSAHERTYATALDAVAHGTLPPGNIIQTYAKTPGKQMLTAVSDNLGVRHYGRDSKSGFMYAVYKPDPNDPTQYNRDENSHRISPDDYLLEDGDYILWAIGHLYDYYAYFRNTITVIPETGTEPNAETEEYGIGY